MQIQKVFRAGNSDVVALPKEVMDRRGIKRGGKVVIEEVPELDWIVIKKVGSKKIKKGELDKWLESALREDGEILDELEIR